MPNYTRAEAQEVVRGTLANGDLCKLYTANFLKWSGTATDDWKCRLSEIVAHEMNLQFERLLHVGEGLEVRKRPLPDHDGTAACEAWLIKRPNTLSEKHMARALPIGTWYPFGQLVGYEVPLRDSNKGKVGAVDLFALADMTLKPVELKIAAQELVLG